MGRKWRFICWIYAGVAVVTLALFVWDAYRNGGFQRHHEVKDLVTIAAIYSAAAVLWPVLIVWVILIYFELVTDTITF